MKRNIFLITFLLLSSNAYSENYDDFIKNHTDKYINKIKLCCGYQEEWVKSPIAGSSEKRQQCVRIPKDKEDQCKEE